MLYLDTRDLEKRREEMQDELDNLKEDLAETTEAYEEAVSQYKEADTDEEVEEAQDFMDQKGDDRDNAFGDLQEWQEEYQEELDELTSLDNEVSEWQDGATLIPEDEFTEYCQELLEDTGDLPKDIPHYIVIDWEATADNLRVDYIEVEYQGTTYLVRNC